MPEGTFRILLKEVPVHQGLIPPGMTLVEEPPEGLAVFRIEGTEAPNPATGKRASWVAEASAETLRQAGLPVRTPAEVLLLHLSRVLMRHADEFLGLQEVQTMLDQLGSVYPKLVDEVVPRVVGLRQLTEVLQRLVREGISIRDLKGIMESLSEWGRIESDPLPLSELVRVSMARQISFAHARPDGRLIVYQIDPEIERAITESIRQTPTGRYIGLSPDMQADILSAIRAQLGSRPDTTGPPVVITEPEVRPYLRRLVAIEFPDCAVLSMRELTTELLPQPIGMIALGTGA
jgi:type III secretion protein V